MENKDEFFQAVRGICIICVILIHLNTGADYKDSVQFSFNYDYWLIFRQFINFPVAFFIFISAYFSNISIARERPLTFISKRGCRILIPYIVWTIFYSTINIMSGADINIKRIVYYFFYGGASAPLYFMVVLIQLIIITPIIVNYLDKKWFNIICILVTPLYLLGLYFCNFFISGQMPLYNVFFPAWFIFYYLGLNVNKKRLPQLLNFKVNKLLSSIFIVSIALLLSILECYLLLALDQTFGFATSQIKVTSLVYAIAVINLLLTVKQYDNQVSNILVKIGDNSFGIFFIHCFYLIFINKALSYLPHICNILVIYQLIALVLVITLSYFTVEISRKILGKKLSSVILGF